MGPPEAGAAPIGGAVLAGPVRRRRTGSRLVSGGKYDLSIGCPASEPSRGRKGEGPGGRTTNPDEKVRDHHDPRRRARPCAWVPDRVAGRVALDRYRLDERLGAGGFGVVWRAHDLKLERDVAVKAVPRTGGEAEHPEALGHKQARTEREALAAARLNHPGIVALYEFGYDDEHIYLVSELVEGATLGELTARRRALRPRRGPDRAGAGRGAPARARARGDPPRRQAGAT